MSRVSFESLKRTVHSWVQRARDEEAANDDDVSDIIADSVHSLDRENIVVIFRDAALWDERMFDAAGDRLIELLKRG